MPELCQVEQVPRMGLMKRDQAMVTLVWEHRFLRTDQLLALSQAFAEPLSEQMLWRRLRSLRKHDYVSKLPMRHQARDVYCLAEQGAKLIAVEQGISVEQVSYPEDATEASDYFLEHTLCIAEFRAALTLALVGQKQSSKLAWASEAELRRQKVRVPVPDRARALPLRPDGLVIFQDPAGRICQAFVEIDLGTEKLAVFGRKVQAYLHYATAQSQFTQYRSDLPFKVLTVTTSRQRRDNLLLTVEELGGGSRFCFTTFDCLSPTEILGAVWKVAGPGESPVEDELTTGDESGRQTGVQQLAAGRLGAGYVNGLSRQVIRPIPLRVPASWKRRGLDRW